MIKIQQHTDANTDGKADLNALAVHSSPQSQIQINPAEQTIQICLMDKCHKGKCRTDKNDTTDQKTPDEIPDSRLFLRLFIFQYQFRIT